MSARVAYRSTPPPSPEEELARFEALQRELVDRWVRLRDVDSGPRDVVVVPSLSLEGLHMSSIPGVTHYEERMLFTLMLLQHPRAHLVYVTSLPLHPRMVDYMVSLVRSVPMAHVSERLTLLSTYDASPRPLTAKILERPRLIQRIARAIDPEKAHMTCFTVSPLERSLAVRLGIPLYGVDPELLELGTKSGSRRVFREAGVSLPAGVEDVRDAGGVAEAVADLWEADPGIERVVVKHDQGFSGEGNAVLSLAGLGDVRPGSAPRATRVGRILEALPTLRFASKGERWERYLATLEQLGGVVEVFVEGAAKRSPSGQLRINPRGELESMSTHDQLVGGPDAQTYMGCTFPADAAYRHAIQRDALAVGDALARRGVIGRVAVDFVAVERPAEPGRWDHYAIEINLRMSGTTHPLMIMRMLNQGAYDPDSGLYLTGRGEPRYYVATDTLSAERYRGLLVEDLLDIAAVQELHYRPWTDTGVVFHLTGALSEFGKVGLTAIGGSPERAQEWYERTVAALDRETAPPSSPGGGARAAVVPT